MTATAIVLPVGDLDRLIIPLKTQPKPPWPRMLLGLKSFVNSFSSSKEKLLRLLGKFCASKCVTTADEASASASATATATTASALASPPDSDWLGIRTSSLSADE